ncbi:MAG: hypothetical protein ACJ8DJ_02190 [Gemmatimonadales bacterium]
MPEDSGARIARVRRMSHELRNTATRLKHQSRFLCQRGDRLRGHSNDLLTVALFHCQPAQPSPKVRRHLVLVA